MIYLNNAGTSWPKPEAVSQAAAQALCAPPSRWSALYEEAHAEVASFFGISTPARLLFTSGCTAALSLAFTCLPWEEGDTLLISGLEHHALSRWALTLARERGVRVEVIPYAPGAPLDLSFVEERLRAGGVALLACTMASNITGELLPVAELCALARRYGVPSLLDGAQLAGAAPLSIEEIGADIFVFAGHKWMLGPQGIGGFYAAPHLRFTAPTASCDLRAKEACSDFPSFCDVGSVNLAGACGLAAGLQWLRARPSTLEATLPLQAQLLAALQELPGARILGGLNPHRRLPVISLALSERSPSAVAEALAQRGIIVRGGLHCAPLAHETLHAPGGTLRISVGPFNTAEHLDALAQQLRALL